MARGQGRGVSGEICHGEGLPVLCHGGFGDRRLGEDAVCIAVLDGEADAHVLQIRGHADGVALLIEAVADRDAQFFRPVRLGDGADQAPDVIFQGQDRGIADI